MENLTESYKKNENSNDANNPNHYIILVVGILIGFFGVVFRFVSYSAVVEWVSNIAFLIGAFICFRCIFKILG